MSKPDTTRGAHSPDKSHGEATKKRAVAELEPETVALRVRRELRQLDESIAEIRATADKKIAEKTGQRAAIIDELSIEVAELLTKLGVTVGTTKAT